jgi:hyperosmotically inducible protein
MTTHLKLKLLLTAGATASTLWITGCSKTADVATAPTPARTVTSPVATVTPPATTLAETSDIDITSGVKTALLLDEQVKGFNIAVETLKGDVRLTGMVDTQAQIDQALKVARAVRGTHSIHDELVLKKP